MAPPVIELKNLAARTLIADRSPSRNEKHTLPLALQMNVETVAHPLFLQSLLARQQLAQQAPDQGQFF
ncbi:hypothetical protein DXT74_14720 [Chromobacterium sp. Rain0013]|nr:hypothetical protein DXT74_14720 [Chromobacterium sp. Rain0013]